MFREPIAALAGEEWPGNRAADLWRFASHALERHLERRLQFCASIEAAFLAGHWKEGWKWLRRNTNSRRRSSRLGWAAPLFAFLMTRKKRVWERSGKVLVKATFDGIACTGSLIKYGYPQHSLHVPKAIREEAGKRPGDDLDVVVWKDERVSGARSAGGTCADDEEGRAARVF